MPDYRQWFPRGLGVALLIVLIDQVSKQWMESVLLRHGEIEILPFFNLQLSYNEGAAFGMLSNAGGWQMFLFIPLAVIISVVIWLWLRKLGEHEGVLRWGLALVLGGALGNVIDRILFGKVIDFIKLYYQDYVWPNFNVADMAITGGVILILFDTLFTQQRKETAR